MSLHEPNPPEYRHVLVPFDGSELAARAMGTAHALAARFGADIHVVGVAESSEAADRLIAKAADLLGDPGYSELDVEISDDAAGAVLNRAAELGESLFCMSTHAHGRLDGAILGSLTHALLREGHEPIVAVGPHLAKSAATNPLVVPEADHLVACVDGHPASERMIHVAAAWAARLGLALTLVTVAEPIPTPMEPGGKWDRHHGPQMDADEYVRDLREQWSHVAPGVRTHVVYDPVSVSGGLREYLDDHPAGLVAVATRAREGLHQAVHRAVADDIIRKSPSPVLVVPPAA